MRILKKRIELIIILLFILLMSVIWILYALRLKEIDTLKNDISSHAVGCKTILKSNSMKIKEFTE